MFLLVAAVFAVAMFLAVPDGEAAAEEYASAPFIVVSGAPESGGYVGSVNIAIEWNGFEPLGYGIRRADGAESSYAYTGPFEFSSEGSYTIYAYYYEGADVRSVSVNVDYIDSTAPYFSGEVSMDVDFSMGRGAYIAVTVGDALGGIARVYVSSAEGETLFSLVDGSTASEETNIYASDCLDAGAEYLYITAEDVAGNTATTGYDMRQLDRAKIREYLSVYAALDAERFTTAGRAELESAFEELESALEAGGTNTSDITAAEQRVARAMGSGVSVVTRYTDTSDGIPSGLSVPDIDISDSGVVIGDDVVLSIGAVTSISQEELDNNLRSVSAISGYRDPIVSAFTLSLTTGDQNIPLGSPLAVTVNMPSSAAVAKVYIYSGGAMRQLSSSITQGRITFYTSEMGDFYLVGDDERAGGDEEPGLTIGDRFFPASVLWTAGGIVLGVAVIAGVTAFLILYFRNKKTK